MKCVPCPFCKSDRIQSRGRKYPIYPAGCVSLIGFPLSLFHQGQTPYQFKCEACGREFTKRTGLAKLNLVVLILIVIAFFSLILF